MKLLALLLLFSTQAYSVTFKEWQNLSKEQKAEYLYNSYGSAQIEIDLDQKKIIKNTFAPADQRKLAKTVYDLTRNFLKYEPGFDTDVEDDMYATVGKLRTRIELFFSKDQRFIGARVDYFQAGCSPENDDFETYHYETIKEAEADNCFDNDVSWSGDSFTDENLNEISSSDYMEWTGH